MLKVPNFEIVIPVVPDLRLYARARSGTEGDRNALEYEMVANSDTIIELPWNPVAPEWLEVYIDGIRLINPPRQQPYNLPKSFEVFNIEGTIVKFSSPISGNLKFICDTQATHWWGGLKLPVDNIQTILERKQLQNFLVENWPVLGGRATGNKYTINYKPGPEFYANSNIFVSDCEPSVFNGWHVVTSSNPGSVQFIAQSPVRVTMIKNGTINGLGNITLDTHVGNGLYAEPVILTQPYHGYARLSTDRKTIVYVPDINYVGMDTFSWTIMTQRGQVGIPKCVEIKVRRK